MQKCSQESFLCLASVAPKYQSNEHDQVCANDFQHLICIFKFFIYLILVVLGFHC